MAFLFEPGDIVLNVVTELSKLFEVVKVSEDGWHYQLINDTESIEVHEYCLLPHVEDEM